MFNKGVPEETKADIRAVPVKLSKNEIRRIKFYQAISRMSLIQLQVVRAPQKPFNDP
jgi:hypothetical protein